MHASLVLPLFLLAYLTKIHGSCLLVGLLAQCTATAYLLWWILAARQEARQSQQGGGSPEEELEADW